MKKFWCKLVMLAMIITLSVGISSVAYAYDEAEITSVNEEYLNSWNGTDFSPYLTDESVDDVSREQFTNWQAAKEQLGEFTAIDSTVISEADGVITAITTATYANDKLTFTLTYDTAAVESAGAMYGIKSIDATCGSTDGGSPGMVKAGMNTLMGMGVVFSTLIVISFVISALKYVPGLIEKFTSPKKKNLVVSNAIDNVVSNITASEEELTDDTELVAVIMAAIMASNEGQVSADGLVVRSIRRRR